MAALAASGHDPVSLDQAGDPPVDLGNESMVRAAAEDVAATVAFLASDAAAALSGQVLCTDGGLILP